MSLKDMIGLLGLLHVVLKLFQMTQFYPWLLDLSKAYRKWSHI